MRQTDRARLHLLSHISTSMTNELLTIEEQSNSIKDTPLEYRAHRGCSVCDDIQSKSTSTLLLCLSVSRSLYTSALRSMDRFDLFVSQAKTLIIQRWRSAIVDQSSSINSPQKVGSRSCARILAYWRSPTVCSLQSAAWRPSSFLGCMLSHLEQLRMIQMQYNTL